MSETIEYQGRTYRVSSEPDYCMSLLDEQGEGVWCGRIEWADNDRYSGRPVKPRHFINGRTVRLGQDSRSTLWWEVPADVPMNERCDLEWSIRNLLEYGYSTIVVESDDGFSTCLGGIEYGAEVEAFMSDLVAEIDWQRETEWLANIERIYAQVGLAGFPV